MSDRAGASRGRRARAAGCGGPRRAAAVGLACSSLDTMLFLRNFFIPALSLPSTSAVADCTASAVSSNLWKAFSFTLRAHGHKVLAGRSLGS